MSKTSYTRKLLVVGVIIAIMIVAAVAYTFWSNIKPAVTKTVVWGTTEAIPGVFPGLVRTYSEYIPCNLIFEPLYMFKPNTFELKPILATNVQAITPSIWEVTLREGIKFHDGTPFNASVVKFCIENTINDTRRPFGKEQIGKIVDYVEVMNETAVRFHLKSPGFAGFPYLLAHPSCLLIYSPTAYLAAGDNYATTGAMGTGPFKLARYTTQEIILEANHDYWNQTEVPKIEKFIFSVYTDPGSMKIALEQGDIDVAHRWIYEADVKSLLNTTRIVTSESADPYVYFLGLNSRNTYLNSTKVRQAIAYAIDYNAINSLAVSRRSYSAMPSKWTYVYPAQNIFERNLTRAKELMKEAGYQDGLPENIEMYFTTLFGTEFVTVSSLIQSNLAEIGVHVDLKSVEWATMLTYRADGTCPMGIFRFTYTLADPHYVAIYIHRSDGSYGKGFAYGNSTINALDDQGAIELNETRRIQLYQQIQQMLDPEAHLIYMFEKQQYLFHSKNMKNLGLDSVIFYNWYNLRFIDKDE